MTRSPHLAAAKAAGLECWVIPTALTRDGDFRAADRVLRSIAEIPGMLFGSDGSVRSV